jgi:hypothetical protein
MKEDKIRITYNEEKGSTIDSCPYWDYKIFKDLLEPGGKIGTGYCTHPLIKDTELECHYGESEIKVPGNCPLKEGQLVKKVELIPAKD